MHYRRNTSSSGSASSYSSRLRSSSQSSNDAPTPASDHPTNSEAVARVEDPTVIVGLACRVPGAQSPSTLWDNIIKQKDLQSKIPEDRFNVDAFYNPVGAHKGTTNAKAGYFLNQDISLFDPEFFHISGKEAEAMDPQQRLLLEVVYEALEDAGITLEDVRGSSSSVFCGSFTNDYRDMINKDLGYYPKYTATGIGNSILANRISYFYDLHGASVTMDTACSSSLVCFHMGNRSVQDDNADLSLVVGSSLHFDPNMFVMMTDLGFLSSDGRCRAFDASGKGYVRGEGICAVILKRKSRAQLHGNKVRAVVRGTGINHDGAKDGITMPNSFAQEHLIRDTYKHAGLDTNDTQYFEAHGTGTQAGDPRESRAIGSVFAPNRDSPLYVGSVKTNIGHLEGASGLAGIIKSTLALERGKIPPNMLFNNPNPNIDFEKLNITVPTKELDWKSAHGVKRASINSFGYGGTNAHAILEGYNAPVKQRRNVLSREQALMVKNRPFLLPLTSHSEKAGNLQKDQLKSFLDTRSQHPIASIARSLSENGRTMHQVRSFLVDNDADSIPSALSEKSTWTRSDKARKRIGFVFTGQGAQSYAMGRQLIEQSPLFRQTLERCDDVLQSLPHKPDWSVVTELLQSKESSRVAQAAFSQPLCTAIQIALVDMLEEWGIKPSVTVGHSAGEMGAAYAAGILTFDDAIVAAFYRGLTLSMKVEDSVKVAGSMMAVQMTEAEATTELAQYEGQIVIAAVNSPTSLTLSGDKPAIMELCETLKKRNVFARVLQIDRAYHSHHIAPFGPVLNDFLQKLSPRAGRCKMSSSVTARQAEPSKMKGPYWVANLTGQVKFADALTNLLLSDEEEINVDILLELGPHPALKGPVKEVMKSLRLDIPYVPSLARGVPDFYSLLACAGQLFALGYPVDLPAVNSNLFLDYRGSVRRDTVGEVIKLPSYSWDHSSGYWAETRVIKANRTRQANHEILGAPIADSIANHPRWRSFLRPAEMPWLSDHMIEGKVIFPAAGYLTMAIEAVIRLEKCPEEVKSIELHSVSFKSALHVRTDDMGTEIVLEMHPVLTSAKRSSDRWYDFVISSYDAGGRCDEHCRGIIGVEPGVPTPIDSLGTHPTLAQLQKSSNKTTTMQRYYEHLSSMGLQYGDNFRLLSGNIESGPGFAMAPLSFRHDATTKISSDACLVHPTFLDASFHVVFAGAESLLGRSIGEPYVPTFIKSMKVSGLFQDLVTTDEQQRFWVSSNTSLPGPRVATSDIAIQSDDCSKLMIEIHQGEFTALGGDMSSDIPERALFFRTRWQSAFTCLGKSEGDPLFDSLSQVMDCFAHQFPDSKLLHASTSIDSVKNVLNHLGGRKAKPRRFQSLTPLISSAHTSEQIKDLEAEWPGRIDLSEPKESQYDAVIIERSSDIDFKILKKYLKPEGFMITNGVDCSDEQMTRIFQAGPISAWQYHQGSSLAAAKQDPLTLVMPSSEIAKRTEVVASAIAQAYHGDVSRIPLLDLAKSSSSLESNVVILASLDNDLFFEESNDAKAHFEAIQKILTSNSTNIVWVTKGASIDSPNPQQGIVLGLSRVARSENENLRLAVLDMSEHSSTTRICDCTLEVLSQHITEDEFAERDGKLMIPKVEADHARNSKLPANARGQVTMQKFDQRRPLALKIGKVGLLETLTFADDDDISAQGLLDDEIEMSVRASAINFRDIAASLGIIDDYKLGDECAGIVRRVGSKVQGFEEGDHVVAWRPGQGAHCSVVRNPAVYCHKLTDMPFTTATAFPLVLTTAHYALCDTARLRAGEFVLVHSAAGGVGQMAIQVAQMLGAKVIATVGSDSKREFLKKHFGLDDSHILSSRNPSFVDGVMDLTHGVGVDVALNSLAGELLHATWSCVARFGRFVEIGKRDIHENAKIDMDQFRKNVSFSSVDMITVFEHNRSLGEKVFQECCQLIENGTIKIPEAVVELPYADVQKGFRLLQMGKHLGKVVLFARGDESVPVVASTYRNLSLFDPAKIYLLVGGLGGLGRTLAEWMVRKGARQLAFLSRSGANRPEAMATVNWLEARDIKVSVYKSDVTDYASVRACIDMLGPQLAGVFQAAMVLQDAPLDKMTHAQWQTSVRPKVKGTYNLHKATLHIDLDFFVCFSSASAVVGAMAQANYSAANTYLDSLMSYRRTLGLEGVTMNCGMIVGVGAVAEDAALETTMRRIGYDAVNEQELLYQIEEAVTAHNRPAEFAPGIDEHQTITGINLSRKDVYWSTKPLLRNLYANLDIGTDATNAAVGKPLIEHLREAADNEKRVPILTSAFIEKISSVLGVSTDIVQPANPLSAYGLDSIVAIEFRKWFVKSINVDLQIFDVLGAKSITELTTKAVGLIKLDEEHESTAKVAKPSGGERQEVSKAPKEGGTESSGASPAFLMIEKPEIVPMSTFQRRMWFQHNMLEDKSSLNLAVSCQITGNPNIPILTAAVAEMKRRNESLRTSFMEGDEFSEQKPTDDCDPHIIHKDLSTETQAERTESVERFISDLRHRELNIEEGEVMRMSLIKTAESEYTLVMIYHHICIDRGSSRSMFQQVMALYEALRNGQAISAVAAPKVSYADFTFWHEARLKSTELQGSIDFWKKKLANAPAASQLLPFAKTTRPAQMDMMKTTLNATLEMPMLSRMKRICAQTGTTPFHFLMAGFRSFHHRYTEEDDLTIHMVDGSRPHPDLEDTIGFFVNLIPIRFTEGCDGNFDALLDYTKSAVLGAAEHNSIPFDVIVEALGLEKSTSHFPLGQLIINYQSHGKMPRFKTHDFEVNNVKNEDIPTACEMQLEALEDPERGLDLRLEYSSTLYGADETDRFFNNFLHYLTSVIKDHRQPVGEVEMCGRKEIEYLRNTLWNTQLTSNHWNGASVIEKFFEVAAANPKAIAAEESNGKLIAFDELLSQSKKIGASLQQSGASTGDVVGVLSKPGIDEILAMLGTLIVGCVYLPMDPEFAIDRLTFMAQDAHARYLLAGDECLEVAAVPIANDSSFETPHLLRITEAKKCKHHLYPVRISAQNAFYIVYTSGSTGNPKGVALTQENTQQMLSTLHHGYSFSPSDKFLHQSSICFDLSIVQMLSALTSGATICVAAPDMRKDPSLLAKYMQQSSISVTYFTPTQFALLLETGSQDLRQCSDYRVAFFAGETLPVRLAKAFHDLKTPASMYNTWSPSELVVQTTIGEVIYPGPETTSISIGKPLANCRHYVLDANMKPLPAGLVGELCVGGAQVGAGYLDRPEANANAFIDDKFCSEEDIARGWTRFFRTGDRGRFLPDGSLGFHGRIAGDRQIKLRGFRMDLGEVEHRIHGEATGLGHQRKLVDLSVVAMPKASSTVDDSSSPMTDERQIVAFLVFAQRLQEAEKAELVASLHDRLSKHLNYYMLPSGYQFLNALPVTIGGKVDRKALLSMELHLTYPKSSTAIGAVDFKKDNQDHKAAEDTILPQILKLFRDILKLPASQDILPTDSFFELGGQSILLLRAHSKIKRTFQIAPSLKELFTAATPQGMAQRVRECIEAKEMEAQNAGAEETVARVQEQ